MGVRVEPYLKAVGGGQVLEERLALLMVGPVQEEDACGIAARLRQGHTLLLPVGPHKQWLIYFTHVRLTSHMEINM